MADIKWIKVSTNMFETNRKIKQIELMPEGDTILVIWLKLMLLAGIINDGGAIYITPEIPYTEESLANELRRPLPVVKLALNIFLKYGMIEIIDNTIWLSSWEKYQNIEGMDKVREQTRERVARHRARRALEAAKQEKEDNAECNVTVTSCNALEEEGEEEREEEYHSFILSENSFSKSGKNGGIVDNSVDNSCFSVDRDVENSKRSFLSGELGKGVVLLSDEQLDDLLKKLTLDEFNKYIGIVADMESSGRHYRRKTHYQAILDMATKDRSLK